MGTALVKDILYRAAVLLNDISTQYTNWTEIEQVDFLNDAQVAVCKFAPWASSRTDSIKLTPMRVRQSIATVPSASMIPVDGSTAFNAQGLFLTSLICNMGSDGLTEGNAIRLVSLETINTTNPAWPTQSGGVVNQYVYDARFPKMFMVLPKPTSAIWVLAAYQALPAPIPPGGAHGSEVYAYGGSSTQTITIDDRYLDDLVHYLVAKCFMKDAEFAANQPKADFFMNLFTGSLKTHAEVMMAMNPALAKS